MAKFTADITKNAAPAMASPEGLIRASQGTAQMLETVVGAARAGMKMYDEYKLAEVEQKAREAQSIFYNEAVEQPEAMRTQAASLEEEAAPFKVGGFMPTAIEGEMKALKEKSTAYQEALKQGRIGLGAYQVRVETLARQAIAANPHLGMQIRETLLRTTGLPYVDRETTAAFYTKQLFAGRDGGDKKNDPEWAVKQDLENINKYLGVPYEQAQSMRVSNPSEYTRLQQIARDKQELTIRGEQLAAVRSNLEQGNWQNAAQVTDATLQLAGNNISKVLNEIMLQNKELLDGLSKLPPGEAAVQSPAFKTQFELLSNQVKGAIKQQTIAARQALNSMAGNMRADDVKAQLARIEAQEKIWSDMADPQGLATVLEIFTKNRDKSFQENMQIATQSYQFASAFMPSGLMQAIATGDKETIDRINATFPGSVDVAKQVLGTAGTSLTGNMRAVQLAGSALVDSAANPEPTVAGAGDSPEDYKAKVNIVSAEVISKYKGWLKTEGVSEKDANQFGTMLSNVAKGSATGQAIWKEQTKFKEIFQKLPPEKQTEIKGAVARQHQLSSQAAVAKLKEYPNLIVGTQPSDGSIRVTAPLDMLIPRQEWAKEVEKSKRNVPSYGGPQATPTPTRPEYFATKYSALSNYLIRPGMEASYAEYEKQARAFENEFGPTLDNLVITRAVAENRDTATIGLELAKDMQSRKEPALWFDNTPKPAAPKAPATIKSLARESDLKGAVASAVDDLKMEISRMEADLADATPGSRLATRLQDDIKNARAELKRQGVQ